jgi:hypothetical protein
MSVLLLVVLVVIIIGVFPRWPHSSSWGYGPSGIGGLILLLVVLWLLFGGGMRHL